MKKTIYCASYAVILLVFLLGACQNEPALPVTTSLPRSVPEAEGVSSEGILAFLEAAANSRHEFHSIMFVRHGKVIAEGWWEPYKPGLRHTLYSTSKSFTSTAVGFAVSEKLLTVHDKVIPFFPEDLPDSVSDFLADMTVRDLLSMTAGQDPDPTFSVAAMDSNWVKAFLAIPVVNDPGTKFLYNSLATYMLSAIVQKVTGGKIIDYLGPRLFEPLGIEGMDWETDPRGINTGGWGLRVKTEDMAKFGQLYLQNGEWNGKQLLPASWIEEATTSKIDQAPDASQATRDSSDWLQGYCYQFWRCRNNAFRADGAYGQYIIVMPEQDAVIAITSESSPDMQDQIDLVWKYLLPAMQKDILPENSSMAAALKQKLDSLTLPPPPAGNISPLVSQISGKTYVFESNDRFMESINFHFMEDMCHITLKIDKTDYSLAFGAGKWITGETTKRGPNLLRLVRAHYEGLPPSIVAAGYGWKDENTLDLVLRYTESPHTETISCKFDKDKVTATLSYSNDFGGVQEAIVGRSSNQ